MPRPKPTEAQRYYMSGYAKNSVMDRMSEAERKQLKEKMKLDRDDRAAFERTMRYGSQPRSG